MSRSHRPRARRSNGSIRQQAWKPLRNPLPPVSPLSAEQVEHLHQASLRLLSDTGMRVLDSSARNILRQAGCVVSEERVRFDPDLVVEAVSKAPREFTLQARDPAKSLVIGGDHVVFSSVGGPAFVSDLVRGRRSGTLAEQHDFLRVVQSLNVVHQEGGGPLEAMDLPGETRHLDLLLAQARLLDKNWQGIALGRERAADSIDMAALRSEERRVGKECRSRWSPYH